MRYNRPVIIETSLFEKERSRPQWHALFLSQKIRVNVLTKCVGYLLKRE